MKKFISILLAVVLINSSLILATRAEEENELGFFETVENMSKLKSYALEQIMSGHLRLEEDGIDYIGNFRIKTETDVINHDVFAADSHMDIKGSLRLTAQGEETPFERIIMGFRAEIITVFNDATYMKLSNVSFSAIGVPEDELEEYFEFRNDLMNKVNKYKGTWYYLTNDYLLDSDISDNFGTELDQEALLNELREKGLKETYRNLLKDMITSFSYIAEPSELEKIQELVNDLFDTNFFTTKEITSGRNSGLQYFTFSKRRFINFIKRVASNLEKPLSENDLAEINDVFSKFYFSGFYHIDKVRKIYDMFQLKLTLRNLGMLKFGRLNLLNKIEDINEPKEILTPEDYTPFEDLPFF